jgi:hypothetical protein
LQFYKTAHPNLQTAFPEFSSSDRLRFSRLQLRGSAGIAPASLSSPHGKDAQTEGHFKEQKKLRVEFTGSLDVSQIGESIPGSRGLFSN